MPPILLLRTARPLGARVLLASSPFAFFSTSNSAASNLNSSSTKSPNPTLTTRNTSTASESALFKQVTYGSIAGFVGGLVISKISRILVILLGFGGVVLHTLGLKGINLLPLGWLGRRFKGVDWSGWVLKNPGLKISFSAALLATAFLRDSS